MLIKNYKENGRLYSHLILLKFSLLRQGSVLGSSSRRTRDALRLQIVFFRFSYQQLFLSLLLFAVGSYGRKNDKGTGQWIDDRTSKVAFGSRGSHAKVDRFEKSPSASLALSEHGFFARVFIDDPTLHLSSLVVVLQFRRHGLAKRLNVVLLRFHVLVRVRGGSSVSYTHLTLPTKA